MEGFSIICSVASSEKYTSKEVYLSVPEGLSRFLLFRSEPLTFMFLYTLFGIDVHLEGHL